ncbi:MAG: proteasome activator [Acidimicrobiales bacterium]
MPDRNAVPLEPEVIVVSGAPATPRDGRGEVIRHPAKVMRIGSMIKQLLDEVRHAPLDEAGRARLAEIYETSVTELGEGLSDDLHTELDRLTTPFGDGEVPTEAELRVAQAQLVGWLEGLFHGMQAALLAQQMAAREQLDEFRQRGLPSGEGAPPPRPGTYL